MKNNLIQWLDDFLLHSRDESSLIFSLRTFFELCQKFGLKVHARKFVLFCMPVKFCGRIIDKGGVKFDPGSLSAISSMTRPNFGGELQQLLCATNWMRSGIPNYTAMIAPLHKIMELLYKTSGKRTKKSVAKLKLSDLWEEKHDTAFASIKRYLSQSIKLVYPKITPKMSLFSDASEYHCGSILTQVLRENMKLLVEDQRHEILPFLSGSFSKSAFRWRIVEKEALAVVRSMSQLDFLTASGVVHLFTDHANLVYIFDPYGFNPRISKQVANKLMKWALKLSAYRYIINFTW